MKVIKAKRSKMWIIINHLRSNFQSNRFTEQLIGMSKTELPLVRTVAPGINDPPQQKRLKNETKQILCQSSDVSSKARRHFRDWLCTYFDQEKIQK